MKNKLLIYGLVCNFNSTDSSLYVSFFLDCAKLKSPSKYDLTAVITHFGSVGGKCYITPRKLTGEVSDIRAMFNKKK